MSPDVNINKGVAETASLTANFITYTSCHVTNNKITQNKKKKKDQQGILGIKYPSDTPVTRTPNIQTETIFVVINFCSKVIILKVFIKIT